MGGNDEIVFAPSINGDYTLKDTYEFLRRKETPWLYHNLVWFKKKIPRHAFIGWMMLNGGLKTLQKLKQWGVVDSDTCVHCWRSQETEEHLFF